MTTIADVLAVARDLSLEALDQGGPVAWVEQRVLPGYVSVHTATQVSEGVWIIRYCREDRWYSGNPLHSRLRFGTSQVRERLLASLAVIDPAALPSTAFPRARSKARR